MEVNTAWQGQILVASLKGEIDMKNQESLASRLEEIAAAGARGLVLNFADVIYIASVGIGLLIQLVKQAKEHGMDIRLAAPRPAVKMVLEMVRVDSLLPMDPTVEDSLARLIPAAA